MSSIAQDSKRRTSRVSWTVSITNPTTIEFLIQAWGRVLRLPSVGLEDNFFDLGGNYSQAVQLFQILSEARGLQLPPVLIYHAPTIVSQACLLDNPQKYESGPVVPLRPGQPNLIAFIAAGLGGVPADFFPIAKLIHGAYSIYGLQPKGIDGFNDPADRIEDMADFYTSAILRFQPNGPYILLGYSLGGLVFLEVARRLVRRGQKITLLVMIDSYPDFNLLSTDQRMRSFARRAKVRALGFARATRRNMRLGSVVKADNVSTFALAFERVRDSAYIALSRYRPAFYPGTVKFIRAAEVSDFPEDAKAVWSQLVEGIQIETVPGNHVGIVTTYHRVLTSVLNCYLEEIANLQRSSA